MTNPLQSVTRRRFLDISGRCAAAAIGASCLAPDPRVSAGILLPGTIPPLVVFSKVYQELKLNFEQAAEVTAEAGLAGIDCPVRAGGEIEPGRASEGLALYAEALAKHKAKIRLLTTGIVGVDSPRVREILTAGRKLNARFYRLGYWYHRSGSADEKEASLKDIRARLTELAAMNRDFDMCALFQNHSTEKGQMNGPVGSDLKELHDLVKDFNPDQIAVAFDLGHAIITHGDDWRKHFERLRDHIRVVYVKDVQRPARFVPFGQGEFGRTDFFQLLAGMRYRAPLSIHIEYPWAPAEKKTREALVQTLKDSRRMVEQWWHDGYRNWQSETEKNR